MVEHALRTGLSGTIHETGHALDERSLPRKQAGRTVREAASFGAAKRVDVLDVWSRVERGEFAPILAWLREEVHRHGHLLEAPDIVRAAVGERDHVEDPLSYPWGRQGALCGVKRRGS